MKKTTALLAFFFVLSSSAAMANETQSKFYGGIGIAETSNSKGTQIQREESWFMSSPYTISSNRTENNNDQKRNIFLGYKLSENKSLEVGYSRSESGFTSETTGTVIGNLPTTDGKLGAFVIVPFSVIQNKKMSSWHFSFIGEKSLSENVSMFGRIGIVKTETKGSQKISYNCSPASCNLYQATEYSSSEISPLLGIGLDVKILKDTFLRVEILKPSSQPVEPKISLVLSFF